VTDPPESRQSVASSDDPFESYVESCARMNRLVGQEVAEADRQMESGGERVFRFDDELRARHVEGVIVVSCPKNARL
jgi:hypothetical protein